MIHTGSKYGSSHRNFTIYSCPSAAGRLAQQRREQARCTAWKLEYWLVRGMMALFVMGVIMAVQQVLNQTLHHLQLPF